MQYFYKAGKVLIKLIILCLCIGISAAADGKPDYSAPYQGDEFKAGYEIDRIVAAGLQKQGLKPAALCSDEVFIRRVYLDTIGTLPQANQVKEFLNDKKADKRTGLIDTLLQSDQYVDYWTLKWCDILRVKAEFPINLWPNAVQAYHRWIYDSIRENKPYDRFARELLTSSGSNFRVPQVNFYRAIQGQEPSAIAHAAALTFMGTRIDKWPESKRKDMETFFSRIAYKSTAEWKEEIVYLDPAPCETIKAVYPYGKEVEIRPGQDPRIIFADWLINEDNQWFAKNIVNRQWFWVFGRGIIHEPDDIRPDNKPVYPELLSYLEKELVKSNYNLKHIFRLILNSNVYQQSSIPASDDVQAEKTFACYPVRRLEAEVLIDILCWISGTKESYSSLIPEPFTFIPEEHRTISLADGSITSQFLEMFGRPSRDTGLENERDNKTSEAQRLHMLNSTHIQNKIEKSWRLKQLVRNAKGNSNVVINNIYLNILSRYPSKQEMSITRQYFSNKKLNMNLKAVDLTWALINSKEFLYHH